MLWTLYFESKSTSLFEYIPIVSVSLITSIASIYLTLRLLNSCKFKQIKMYYERIEQLRTFPTYCFSFAECIFSGACLIIIVGWLATFGAFSNLLTFTDVVKWILCWLGAAAISYLVIDSLLVALFYTTKRKRLFLLLALRSISVEYVAGYWVSDFIVAFIVYCANKFWNEKKNCVTQNKV